jgi:hypothetical protein
MKKRIIAIGSLDRLISTYKPHSILWKNKQKNQYICLSVIALLDALCISYAAIDPIPKFFNNNTDIACFFSADQGSWIFFLFKVEYALIRVFFPFIIMIVSSIMVTYKMCKKQAKFHPKNTEFERERQLFISLISYDIFFMIFRVPMVVYSFINTDPVTFFTSFAYCICLAIGLLSNVLIFVVLIFFNKVYKKIFIQIIKCNKNKQKQSELRNVLRNKIANRNFSVKNVEIKKNKETANIRVNKTETSQKVYQKSMLLKTESDLNKVKNSVDLNDVEVLKDIEKIEKVMEK